jgi:tetratricopeptide (TPR) repeat protein
LKEEITVFHDRYGLPLSTRSQAAADLFVDALDRIVSFDVDPVQTLERAIEADEGFALPHAVLALQRQLQGDAPGATSSIERAVALSPGTTPREQSFVGALNALISGGGARGGGATAVIPVLEAHLQDHPRDFPVFIQMIQTINQSGTLDRKQVALAKFRQSEQFFGNDWAFSASYAMNLQEIDNFDEALQRAQISLDQRPKNATAIHPIAHTYFETNNHAEGEAVVAKWLEAYEWRAPYHCHLSWHMALFSLGMGRYDRVLQIWENDIKPVEWAQTQLVDSASLLWRLRLYDCVDQALDWERVKPLAEAALARPAASFFFAHAALYYAAAADDATFDKLVDALRDLNEKGHPLAGGVMLAFVMGLRAFSHADYETAATTMQPYAAELPRLGGSNAQAEVYTETYIEACLRAGRYDWAESALRKRLKRRQSARDCFWLGRSLAGLERPADAAQALNQAQQLWNTTQAVSPELQRATAMLDSLPS